VSALSYSREVINAVNAAVSMEDIGIYYDFRGGKGHINSPLRDGSNSRSFSIYPGRNGRLRWHDHVTHESGDAVAFVQLRENLSAPLEAARFIDKNIKPCIPPHLQYNRQPTKEEIQKELAAKAQAKNYAQRESKAKKAIASILEEKEKAYADKCEKAPDFSTLEDSALDAFFGEISELSEDIQALKNEKAVFDDKNALADQLEVVEKYAPAQPEKPRKERLTLDLLHGLYTEQGYSVRMNQLSRRIDFERNGEIFSSDSIITRTHSAYGGGFSNFTPEILERYTLEIAKQHEYNPVSEYLQGIKWDGQSRIEQIMQILHLDAGDWLSRVLVKKWLFQTVAMLLNDSRQPYGAEGVLTFQGEQGVGKTSFFSHLAMQEQWFAEGAKIDNKDKDNARRVVTVWIAELGEVETTFRRTDVESLKSFITQKKDRYRLPYGRTDEEVVRRSSLCATCNGTGFLADETGNRRWFVVPISGKIDRDELERLDASQLWAEIFAMVSVMTTKERGGCFRLTDEERKALDRRNTGYQKPISAQEDVQQILDECANNPKYQYSLMTVSEWQQQFEALRKYPLHQIGKALTRCGIEQERTKTEKKRRLPCLRWGAIYPECKE